MRATSGSTMASDGYEHDVDLRYLAGRLNQAERPRVAIGNQLAAMTRMGYDMSHPEAIVLQKMADELAEIEKEITKEIEFHMKCHPLAEFVQNTTGLGLKMVGRFVGAVDWRRERTPAQLWKYCGLHVEHVAVGDEDRTTCGTHDDHVGVAPRRKKGKKSAWNPEAKVRALLLGRQVIRYEGSAYREVYLQRREHTKSTHPDWTDGHSHNDAIRFTAKRILKDMLVATSGNTDPTGVSLPPASN